MFNKERDLNSAYKRPGLNSKRSGAVPKISFKDKCRTEKMNEQLKKIADNFNVSLMRSGIFIGLSFLAALLLSYMLLGAVTLVVGSVLAIGTLLWRSYYKKIINKEKLSTEPLASSRVTRPILESRLKKSIIEEKEKSLEAKINDHAKKLFPRQFIPEAKAPLLSEESAKFIKMR